MFFVISAPDCHSTPFLWCLPKETVSSRQRKALFLPRWLHHPRERCQSVDYTFLARLGGGAGAGGGLFLNDVRLQAPLAAVFLVETLDAGLGAEIQHRGGALLRKGEQPAANALLLILGQYEQLGYGAEIVPVAQDAQTADQQTAVVGGDIQRPVQRLLSLCLVIVPRARLCSPAPKTPARSACRQRCSPWFASLTSITARCPSRRSCGRRCLAEFAIGLQLLNIPF